MNLFTLIFGIIICVFLSAISFYFSSKQENSKNLFYKLVFYFAVILFALILNTERTISPYFTNFGASLIIASLFCFCLSSLLFFLKKLYPFHENEYSKLGFVFFGVASLLNIFSLCLFASVENENFLQQNLIAFLSIFAFSVAITFVFQIVSKKVLKFDFKKLGTIKTFQNLFLIFSTIFAGYLSILKLNASVYFMFFASIFVLAYSITTSFCFFKKEENKTLKQANEILFFCSQILFASFIYFI